MSDQRQLEIEPWLQTLWDQGGSDLLLSGGSPPRIRVDGRLRPVEGVQILTGDQISEIALPLLTDGQRMIFEEQLDVDFAFSWQDKARLRASAFTQRGQTALALRMIPSNIPSFTELGLPPAAEWLAQFRRRMSLPFGSPSMPSLMSSGRSDNLHPSKNVWLRLK